MAEQLLAFAAPVFAEGGLAREEPNALHNVLRFAAMAWNLGGCGKRDASLYCDHDFIDNREHCVNVLEIFAPGDLGPLPRWISGQNAAPPEDVGGAGGYADFLETMADPTNEEHAAMRGGVGRNFDAHAFDLVHTNRLLALLGRRQDDERRAETRTCWSRRAPTSKQRTRCRRSGGARGRSRSNSALVPLTPANATQASRRCS